MWIFGQVWLFSLVAFALGVLLTWLVWARPLRRRVTDLERQLTRSQSAPALAGGSRSTMAAAFTGSGARSSAFTGPNTYGDRRGGGGPSSPSVTAFNTSPTPVDEPPAKRAPSVREASFFDEPDQYDTSWRRSLRHQDTAHSEPVAEPAEGHPRRSSGPVPAPEEDQPEEDQDADYFAYLDEIGARDRTQPAEPAGDLAEQRGTLRFSSPAGATGEEQAEPSAAEGHRVERIVLPTSFSGSNIGSSDDLGSESTQLLRPTNPEGAPELHGEPTGTVSGRLSGELSGRLDVPEAAQEPVAQEPVAEGLAAEEPTVQEPARSDDRNRSLFEPALQPQDEATTVRDAGESPSASQPMGPFGPGSALPRPDGSAPASEFQVKARTSSMVFHTTSSPFYDRLLPQVWFHTAEDAMRAGFTSWERPEGTWGEQH